MIAIIYGILCIISLIQLVRLLLATSNMNSSNNNIF